MANLTKKQRRAIEQALYHAKRAHKFLQQKDIAVGRLDTFASTTLHYTRSDGSTFYAIDKEIGSDLTGVQASIELLQDFLK